MTAADADPTIPKSSTERMALLRRTFIPALARIDPDTRAARRRVARFSELPQEAHGLVQCLVDVHLLCSDTEIGTGERVVEPAHETLLRQWDALQAWLDDNSAAL